MESTSECSDWIQTLDESAREAVLRSLFILRGIGPALGRPHVDTVKGSAYANMKELRVQHKQRVIRIFFAFDPRRTAVLLIGGDKRGDKRFYDRLIARADRLFAKYLEERE
ncbi:MAG: type II toxin-antitoxin system RelE/ParE family toxin [Spirochaetales bacterium]|nr:type II toxin-antitoxin system RelE/ParE family toxin [Spirochaetales bacterium]